ncbi:MAG TPA: hypothetical protein P5210_06180 [Draconibacterium sp.]|nr:hypothetical protein [Draconibacterium sp.]HRX11215.1 hypothetical protein [Draconibacterium sp.]
MRQLIASSLKLSLICFLLMNVSCNSNQKTGKINMESFKKGTYGYDLNFLKEHKKPLELKNGDARVLISPEYQGRVMTSSANGENGLSFGWINYDLISSGEIKEHINAVGGEERFWLGPEGGQFSIFFKPGTTFEFANWQTPAVIDTEAFNVVESNETTAEFSKSVQISNYAGFSFNFDVNRRITLLDNQSIKNELGIVYQEGIKSVGYSTQNKLTNTGNEAWIKETGLLSVWLLGMFNPSDEVTIIVPYKTEAESDYIVKDDYFGKIPSDRLVVKNGIAYLKGDGKQRGKIGIPPQRALPVIGSFDAANKILTVLKCEVPEGINDYVNSAWELQEFPFKGDAINSYNDGPLEDGSQMGPFYELETSSQALALKPNETAIYKQTTIHFEGTEEELNAICQQVFGISLEEVKAVF